MFNLFKKPEKKKELGKPIFNLDLTLDEKLYDSSAKSLQGQNNFDFEFITYFLTGFKWHVTDRGYIIPKKIKDLETKNAKLDVLNPYDLIQLHRKRIYSFEKVSSSYDAHFHYEDGGIDSIKAEDFPVEQTVAYLYLEQVRRDWRIKNSFQELIKACNE